jgi:hypothetical protein
MQEYMQTHPYYAQFLTGTAKRQNLVILFLGVVCALLPAVYMTKSKKKSFWPFILFVWAGLWIFGTSYVGIKSDLFWWAWMKMILNTWFLLGLGTLFFAQLLSLGRWINERFVHIPVSTSIVNFLFSLAIGLVCFLSIQRVLLITNLAFPLVNRVLWWAGVYLVWLYKNQLQEMWSWLMEECFSHHKGILGHSVLYLLAWILVAVFSVCLFYRGQGQVWARFFALLAVVLIALWIYKHPNLLSDGGWLDRLFTLSWLADIAVFLLLILFIWYLYNGIILAYIPYPTAWDANHAYMFFPKMYALNDGYFRNEIQMRGYPSIWMPYISFWFSLFWFSNWFLWISADTIAIEMNFLSGIFVIIFGTGLMRALTSVLREWYKDSWNITTQRLLVVLWSFLIFQWVSSGMGAFLVFIDNKTDMWVLTLIIVALLSGFLFFREHLLEDVASEKSTGYMRKWLMLSWLFFAFAVLAKPTALFDVFNFFLLLRGSRFGLLWVFWLPLLIMWWLALIKMRGVNDYFTTSFWAVLALVWWAGVVGDFFVQWTKKILRYGKFLLLRWVSFLVILVGVKLLYYIPDVLFYGNDGRGPKEWVQNLLLASEQNEDVLAIQLAQNDAVTPPPALCSLQAEGLVDADALYKDLKPMVWDGYDEDVGRYIGYGRKGNPSDQRRWILPFIDTRRVRGMDVWCHSFSPFFLDSNDAVVLCETEDDWKSFAPERLSMVQNQLRANGDAFTLLENLKNWAGTASVAELTSEYREDLLALDGIMQGESMKVVEKTSQDTQGQSFTYKEAYLPYKYLNFFNITFNRSLQNLSSYYTDIGIVWLLLIFLSVIWLLYGIVQRERFLVAIHVVTIFWRLLWLVVGWGILWYGIWIIIWSILSFLTFLYSCSRRTNSVFDVWLLGIFVTIFLFAWLWQGRYNLVRISTQGGGGPFMRYKTNHGALQRVDITAQGQILPVNVPTWRYGSDEVFSLQFPHYKKFLTLINERGENDGALIAGTYARYFITNQKNILNDQFLAELSQWFSDNNVCRSYLRLQDKGLRYLAIDPNIGTVVQGDGNQWLFERFFARLNPTSWAIEQHGTMSMLAALNQQGYIRYVSSNNLGAKYALTMPDSAFWGMTWDALVVMRAKMMIARFFQEQPLLTSIISLADQRVKDGTFFEDIADLIGAEVNPATTQKIVAWAQLNPAELTEDEKRVLTQFFWLRQQLNDNPTQYQQTLQNMVMQSLWAWNQVIVMEVVQ